MPNPSTYYRPQGISLLELLISIALLSVGLLTVLGLFLTMVSQTDSDGLRTQASHLLESYHGEAKAHTEDDWISFLGTPVIAYRKIGERDMRIETEFFRLSDESKSPDFRVYVIRSTVFWKRIRADYSTGRQESRLSLTTQVSPLARY